MASLQVIGTVHERMAEVQLGQRYQGRDRQICRQKSMEPDQLFAGWDLQILWPVSDLQISYCISDSEAGAP